MNKEQNIIYCLRYWSDDRDTALGLYDLNHLDYVKDLCKKLNSNFDKYSRQGVYYEELKLNEGTEELNFQLRFLEDKESDK